MAPRRLFGLMRITKYYCITPNYNNNTQKFNNTVSWKIKQTFMLLFICVSYFVQAYYFEEFYSKEIQPHEKLIGHALTAILAIINLLTAIQVAFTKRNQWELTIKKISKILEKLKGLIDVEEVEFSSYFSYAAKHLLLIINFVFFVITTDKIYLAVFAQNANIRLIWLALVMDDITTFLKYSFRKINEIITRELDTEIKIENFNIISVKKVDDKNYSDIYKKTKIIQKLTDVYADCCDVINFYNDLFGWIFVLICVFTVISVLPGLETIIWKIIPGKYKRINDVIWSIVAAAFKLSVCLIIIKSCHEATEEGNLIKITATNALQLLPGSDKYNNLQNELNLLADLNDCCAPVFSAAAVFPIDNSLFYILFTMITSYLIVLIQFLESPNPAIDNN